MMGLFSIPLHTSWTVWKMTGQRVWSFDLSTGNKRAGIGIRTTTCPFAFGRSRDTA